MPTRATPYPNTTPEAASALIEQAIGLLLDRYVDPLSSADLYATAYDGVVAEAGKAGRATPGARPEFTGDAKGDAARFRQAYLGLLQGAGPQVNQTAVAYMAIRAVATKIDECHTNFLDPDQYQQVTASLEGKQTYGGIGASLRPSTHPTVIGEVFPGTPAEKAGLKPGDQTLAVDGTDVSDLAADQVAALVRGDVGTQVRLTIQRPGEPAPRTLTITRAQITVPVFNARVIDGPNGTKIGYMKVYSFSSGVEKELDNALKDFQKQQVTAWIIDLRDNGGGYINTLTELASRFEKDGPIGITITRGGQQETIPIDPKLYLDQQLPLAVLINAGSASASEAFSGAMQDYGRAHLVGETSAGCLAAAMIFPLADGSAMNITIQKILSPKGHEINRIGVHPDEAVPPDPNSVADPQLQAAVNWLATQH